MSTSIQTMRRANKLRRVARCNALVDGVDHELRVAYRGEFQGFRLPAEWAGKTVVFTWMWSGPCAR